MNKNIVVKKEKPFCQLKKIPGVEKYKVDAYWINDTSDIEPTLELGYACTSSGNNGAINIWKDDTGMIRSELMRHLVVVKKKRLSAMQKWKNVLVIGLKELTNNNNEAVRNFSSARLSFFLKMFITACHSLNSFPPAVFFVYIPFEYCPSNVPASFP